MQYSQAVPKFLEIWEGLSLEPYKDVGGKWTWLFGQLMSEDDYRKWIVDGSVPGTLAMARAAMAMKLDSVQQQVDVLTFGLGLRQCEFDALCCFVYNVGAEAFAKSTMLQLLKEPTLRLQACDEFPRWDHVDGKIVPGLLSRRLAERQMFLGAP